MPFLRHGHPIGARDRRSPAVHLVVCRCSQCVASSTAVAQDGLTGNIVSGRLMGYHEYQEHCARAAALKIAEGYQLPADSHVPLAVTTETIASSTPPVLFRVSQDRLRPLLFVSDDKSGTSEPGLYERWDQVEAQLQSRRTALPLPDSMIFEHPPSIDEVHAQPGFSDAASLLPNAVANQLFLDYERWLREASAELHCSRKAHAQQQRLDEVLDKLHVALTEFQQMKTTEWTRRDTMLRGARAFQKSGGTVISTGLFDQFAFQSRAEVPQPEAYLHQLPIASQPLRYACHLLVATLYLLCSLSVDQCHFVALMLRLILALEFPQHTARDPRLIPSPPSIYVPESVISILKPLNLEPVTHRFACCPKCFCCYPHGGVPELCSNRSTPCSPACAYPLRKPVRRKGSEVKVPARPFLYHDFYTWMGKLLCRPGMERNLDGNVLHEHGDGVMRDIWDGKVLREFRGPDGQHFLDKRRFSEGRYIFSLNMDGFNPFFKRTGGKRMSSGAIYLVCLNLPPSLRYRLENMFLVCVIPGPHEPSMWEINHLLRPLVDDFVVLWLPGVYYSRSHTFAKGRHVKCAIVPLVCDLLAARQMAGQAPVSSVHFCQFCSLPLANIDNLNMSQWGPQKSRQEYMQAALAWKDARTDQERDVIYHAHGIWYSELLRLPYWDPTRYVAIDTMHNLLLGNLRFHCRSLWGMGAGTRDADGRQQPAKKRHRDVDPATLRLAWNDLQRGDDKDIQKMPQYLHRALCVEAGIGAGGKGPELLRKLLEFRVKRGWVDSKGRAVHPDPALNPVPGSPVTKRELDRAEILLASSSRASLSKTRAETLRALTERESRKLNVQLPWASMTRKTQYVDSLYSMTNAVVGLESPARQRRQRMQRGVVLGRQTLRVIRHDLATMSLPSWLGRLPADLGSSRHGSLSADQWRSVATVSLMASLPHYWGVPNGERDQVRFAQMMDNFVDLVHATTIATSRSLTVARVEEFHASMLRYLQVAQRLYQDMTIRPNHHLSLHLRELFFDFGPSHAWRCFAFERYNSVLQHISTTGKSGEMEVAMLQRCCMIQNIRALLDNPGFPSSLVRVADAFHRVFGDLNRGTLLNDVFALGEAQACHREQKPRRRPLEPGIYALLCAYLHADPRSPHAPVYDAIQRVTVMHKGIKFSTAKVSDGDSNVVYGNIDDQWHAGKITAMFLHDDLTAPHLDKVLVVVRPFLQLSPEDTGHNPYHRYRNFRVAGRLYYKRLSDAAILLPLSQIVCHCACTALSIPNIGEECLHVLPLYRVSHSPKLLSLPADYTQD